MKQIDKNALVDWEKYKEDVMRSTPVDQSMSHAEREKHRIYLEAHPIEWINRPSSCSNRLGTLREI